MAESERLVLPPSLEITPVAELAADLRRRIGAAEGEFALTRRRGRTTSIVVHPGAMALLRRFRTPTTVAEALVAHSRACRRPPLEVFADYRPLFERLLRGRFLVPAAESDGEEVVASLAPGDRVGAATVVYPVQVLEDSEVYAVCLPGSPAALKIRRDTAAADRRAIDHEAAVLERLDGPPGPRLIARGEVEGRAYLLLEWIAGADVEAAARPLREQGDRGRAELLRLATAVAGTYAGLHRRDVLHGDVHPRNVLALRDGTVRLVDFGLAVSAASAAHPPGGGVSFYLPPEQAAAALAGASPPPLSAAAEQFSVGALLYRLLAGAHYCDFLLERTAMMGQIAGARPRPFTDHGLRPWPQVEAVLRRALARDPAGRFPHVADLASALRGVEAAPAPARGCDRTRQLGRLRRRVLADAAPGGAWLREPLPGPRASIAHGAAGVAWALRRMALQGEDPELLTAADLWVRRALATRGEPAAFRREEAPDGPEPEGERSPFHALAGVFAAEALVAHAAAEPRRLEAAVERFAAASVRPVRSLDLTLGTAGTLVGGALLGELLPSASPAAAALHLAGETALGELWGALSPAPPVAEGETAHLGVAHGWGGFLYATLLWCRAAGHGLPGGAGSRLEQLARLAEPAGRGLRWPWHLSGSRGSEENSMPGWCGGSAGYVFLWSLAAEVLQESRYLDLAEGAGWNAWDHPSPAASLCCGLVGRAYALLRLYRATGRREWLERARELALRAADRGRFGPHRHSLLKGQLALAVLAGELERPDQAAFPLFEEEGWRRA